MTSKYAEEILDSDISALLTEGGESVWGTDVIQVPAAAVERATQAQQETAETGEVEAPARGRRQPAFDQAAVEAMVQARLEAALGPLVTRYSTLEQQLAAAQALLAQRPAVDPQVWGVLTAHEQELQSRRERDREALLDSMLPEEQVAFLQKERVDRIAADQARQQAWQADQERQRAAAAQAAQQAQAQRQTGQQAQQGALERAQAVAAAAADFYSDHLEDSLLTVAATLGISRDDALLDMVGDEKAKAAARLDGPKEIKDATTGEVIGYDWKAWQKNVVSKWEERSDRNDSGRRTARAAGDGGRPGGAISRGSVDLWDKEYNNNLGGGIEDMVRQLSRAGKF